RRDETFPECFQGTVFSSPVRWRSPQVFWPVPRQAALEVVRSWSERPSRRRGRAKRGRKNSRTVRGRGTPVWLSHSPGFLPSKRRPELVLLFSHPPARSPRSRQLYS